MTSDAEKPDPRTGDAALPSRPPKSWPSFFALRDKLAGGVPDDFLADRSVTPQDRDPLDDAPPPC